MSERELSADIRQVQVTRRTLRQKELTVTATSGRYGKNEVVLHLTGLPPEYDISTSVWEVEQCMLALQKINPGEIEVKTVKKELTEKP